MGDTAEEYCRSSRGANVINLIGPIENYTSPSRTNSKVWIDILRRSFEEGYRERLSKNYRIIGFITFIFSVQVDYLIVFDLETPSKFPARPIVVHCANEGFGILNGPNLIAFPSDNASIPAR